MIFLEILFNSPNPCSKKSMFLVFVMSRYKSIRKDTDKHDKQKARCTRIFGTTGFFIENFYENFYKYSTKASIGEDFTA